MRGASTLVLSGKFRSPAAAAPGVQAVDEAVAALSDLISRSAQAQAEGRPQEAEALWESSARALAGAPR